MGDEEKRDGDNTYGIKICVFLLYFFRIPVVSSDLYIDSYISSLLDFRFLISSHLPLPLSVQAQTCFPPEFILFTPTTTSPNISLYYSKSRICTTYARTTKTTNITHSTRLYSHYLAFLYSCYIVSWSNTIPSLPFPSPSSTPLHISTSSQKISNIKEITTIENHSISNSSTSFTYLRTMRSNLLIGGGETVWQMVCMDVWDMSIM